MLCQPRSGSAVEGIPRSRWILSRSLARWTMRPQRLLKDVYEYHLLTVAAWCCPDKVVLNQFRKPKGMSSVEASWQNLQFTMGTYLLILPSLCAILPCTSATPLLDAKLGNPCTVNWCLASAWCLVNSALVTQKAPHLPKHLAWFQCTYLRPIWNSKSTWESEEVLQCLQFMILKKSNHRFK